MWVVSAYDRISKWDSENYPDDNFQKALSDFLRWRSEGQTVRMEYVAQYPEALHYPTKKL